MPDSYESGIFILSSTHLLNSPSPTAPYQHTDKLVLEISNHYNHFKPILMLSNYFYHFKPILMLSTIITILNLYYVIKPL